MLQTVLQREAVDRLGVLQRNRFVLHDGWFVLDLLEGRSGLEVRQLIAAVAERGGVAGIWVGPIAERRVLAAEVIGEVLVIVEEVLSVLAV